MIDDHLDSASISMSLFIMQFLGMECASSKYSLCYDSPMAAYQSRSRPVSSRPARSCTPGSLVLISICGDSQDCKEWVTLLH